MVKCFHLREIRVTERQQIFCCKLYRKVLDMFEDQVNRIKRLQYIICATIITVKYMSLYSTKPSRKHRGKNKQLFLKLTSYSRLLWIFFLFPFPLAVKASLSNAKNTTMSTRTKTRRALTFILVSTQLRFVGRLEISSDFCLKCVEFLKGHLLYSTLTFDISIYIFWNGFEAFG